MLLGIGIAVFALGIIGVIWGIMQKMKAGRVADAPLVKTGEAAARGPQVAGPRGAISVQGNVMCQQPLTAPFSGAPCLYYKIKCTARWKDGDTHKSKDIDEQKAAAQFAVDDGSGPVWVDAREGGDFEPTQSKSETRGTGLLGGITGTDIAFGHYRVSTGMLSLGTEYTVQEEMLPLEQTLYVCGKIADGGGAIGSPSWRQMLISNKGRDQLLASATKGAKIFLIGGAAALFVGSAMAVVAQVFLADDKPEGTASSASASAAPAAPTTPATGAAAAKPASNPATPAKPAVKPVAKPGAAATPGKPSIAPPKK